MKQCWYCKRRRVTVFMRPFGVNTGKWACKDAESCGNKMRNLSIRGKAWIHPGERVLLAGGNVS